MSIMPLVFGLIIGTAWLVVCIIFIQKIKIRQQRTPLYVLVVILFILCSGVFTGFWIGSSIGKGFLRENAVLADEFLKENYGNSKVVAVGVDVSEVPQAITELEAMVPTKISEFGLSGIFLETLYKKVLHAGFNELREKTSLIVSYANTDGKITSTTIIGAIENEIRLRIDRWVFRTNLTLGIILALFLILCIILSMRKSRETVVYGKTG